MALPAAPTNVHATANFTTAATPTPYVVVYWDNVPSPTVDSYNVYRNGTQIANVLPLAAPTPVDAYQDNVVTAGLLYNYTVQAVKSGASGPGTLCTVGVPLSPGTFNPAPPPVPGGTRWVFTDVYQKSIAPYTYSMEINPNDGGSPTFNKAVSALKVTGPNEVPLIQEGSPGEAQMSFSGVILSQTQLEAMEEWYRKRILILVQDDLGRRFYGVFSTWTPKRARRASNFWYHTYDAQMTLLAYYNASGQRIYGRFL